MSFITRALAYITPAAPAAETRTYQTLGAGGAGGGSVGRRVHRDFGGLTAPNRRRLNGELINLQNIREASREVFDNSEVGERYAGLLRQNVAGRAGFTASFHQDIPLARRQRLREAFNRFMLWDIIGADGESTMQQILEDVLIAVARDGDVLMKPMHLGGARGKIAVGVILGSNLWEITSSSSLTANRRDGEHFLGVDVDKWGKPLFYWVRDFSHGGGAYMSRWYDRGWGGGSGPAIKAPASQFIHVRMKAGPDSIRGKPWLSSILERISDIKEIDRLYLRYFEIATRIIGSIERNDEADMPHEDSGIPGAREIDQAGTPAGVEPGVRSEPRLLGQRIPDISLFDLDQGESAKWADRIPVSDLSGILDHQMRLAGAGAGLPVHEITADFSRGSYSAVRQSLMSARQNYIYLQDWLARRVVMPMWQQWIKQEMIAGRENPMPLKQLNLALMPELIGARWPWIDPGKDSAAAKTRLEMGLTSRRREIIQQGSDPDKIDAEIEDEKPLDTAKPEQDAKPPKKKDEGDGDGKKAAP